MGDEAASAGRASATVADRGGLAGADAVPGYIAAERIDVAHRGAAGGIVACSVGVSHEAASCSGPAARSTDRGGLAGANAVPRGVAAERIDSAHRVAALSVVAGLVGVSREAASRARAAAGGANCVRFTRADAVPSVGAAERIDRAYGRAADRVVAAVAGVSCEAATAVGIAAAAAHSHGFIGANAVPRARAAEGIGIADQFAATEIIAARAGVGDVTIAIARDAATGAQLLGFVDANAVP